MYVHINHLTYVYVAAVSHDLQLFSAAAAALASTLALDLLE